MSDSPSQYTARNQVSLGPAMGLLAQGAVFWKPDYLRPSPWLEHVPMLFWLAEAVQPRLAVSVGEGGDVSHFALCQATDRLRLDAACYLVAEQVPDDLSQRNEHYASFAQCLEMPALAAADQFSDQSVDLLVLDSKAEKLQEQIDAWLPRMSAHSVVVLAGVGRRQAGHQGHVVFDRLAKQYPSIGVSHGGGAGVVVVGNSPRTLVTRLLEISQSGNGIQVARDVFARLGRACHDAWQAQERASQFNALEEAFKLQQAEVSRLAQQYEQASSQLAVREAEAAAFKQRMEQQLEQHAQERGTLAERVSTLQELRHSLMAELERLNANTTENRRAQDERTEQLLQLQRESIQHIQQLEQARAAAQLAQHELSRERHNNVQLEQLLKEAKEDARRREDQLNLEVQAAQEQAQRLEAELQGQAAHIENLQQQLLAQHAETEAGTQRISALERQLNDAGEQSRQQLLRFQYMEQHLRDELLTTSQQLEKQNNALQQAQEQVEQLNQQLAEERERAQQQAEQLNTQLSRERERALEAEKHVQEYADNVQRLERELNDFATLADQQLQKQAEQSRQQLDEQVLQLQQQLQTQTQELQQARQGKQQLGQQVQQKEQALEHLKAQLAKQETSLNQLQAQIKQKDQATDQLRAAEKRLKSEVQSLKSEVQNLKTEAQRTQQQLAEQTSHARQHEHALAEKEKALQELQKQVEGLRADLQQRHQALVDLRVQENLLKHRLEEQTNELVELTRMLEDVDPSPAFEKPALGTPAVAAGNVGGSSSSSKSAAWTKPSLAAGLFGGNKAKREERRLVHLIQSSGKFNADWYLQNYPDVALHPNFSRQPVVHYLKFGAFEGRDPGPDFSSDDYLDAHPQLRAAGINPLVHFLTEGRGNGR